MIRAIVTTSVRETSGLKVLYPTKHYDTILVQVVGRFTWIVSIDLAVAGNESRTT